MARTAPSGPKTSRASSRVIFANPLMANAAVSDMTAASLINNSRYYDDANHTFPSAAIKT